MVVFLAIGRKVNAQKSTEQREIAQKALKDGEQTWRSPPAA
ncbi:unnamed protein product [Ectocarpus sp. CCAP 1310/34]|nr:unnamed protein product [Ectocarpus sp. CCAP 1310/34]